MKDEREISDSTRARAVRVQKLEPQRSDSGEGLKGKWKEAEDAKGRRGSPYVWVVSLYPLERCDPLRLCKSLFYRA